MAKADTKLFNKASQVVLVRQGDRTVLTMANDFQGDPKEFAVVIPVPVVLQKGQIHIGDKALLDHLDAYSAPRLVEYFDEDPCAVMISDRLAHNGRGESSGGGSRWRHGARQEPGRHDRSQYTVGEYDILILSAQQSSGLETWLRESGYRIPAGAGAVLNSYIRQNLKFFVAKVNLKEQARLGYTVLRPIQVAYESPKFMLPIRLGMVNADGPQELFVYALTRNGRVEATNYRTVKLPTGDELPLYVKDRFADFYKAMFAHQAMKENMSAIFTEYAWDMGWCDPCAADPLSEDELRSLGVFWLNDSGDAPRGTSEAAGASSVRPAQCFHHAAARSLRRRAFSRGPCLSGDGRSDELPGTLRPAGTNGRARARATRPSRYRAGTAKTAGARSAEPRHADRMEHQRHPPIDEDCSAPPEPAAWWQRIWK